MKIGQPRRRSEEIRRKLSKESQRNIRQASRRLTEPSVTYQTHKSTLHTDEDAKMNVASATKRRFRFGWRILSLTLCSFLSYRIIDFWRSPQYLIDDVKIFSLQRLSPNEVLSAVSLNGQHILSLDPESVIEKISTAFPEIRAAQIHVELPAEVSITAIERQPIINWQTQDQRIWIDGEGFLIPARGEASISLTIQSDSLPSYSLQIPSEELDVKKTVRDKASYLPGIPSLNFFSIPKRVNNDLLNAILQLNAWMPEEKTLLYQVQRGLGWHDPRGWDVYVGQRLENINDKMVMYQMIVRELDEQGINPSLVSVEFLHAPYYQAGD